MTSHLSQNVMTLSENEQARLFGVIKDHADVLRKIIPDMPILEAIYKDDFGDLNDPVIQKYLLWKSKQR